VSASLRRDGATSGRVCREVVFDLIDAGAVRRAVVVRLSWTPTDPYAVAAEFVASRGPVWWVLSRCLLADGLDGPGPVGVGDVTWALCPDRPDRVRLRLCSPTGWAVFEASAYALEDFLLATWEVVGPGEESGWLAVPETPGCLLDGDGGGRR